MKSDYISPDDIKAQQYSVEILTKFIKTRSNYGKLRALEELLMTFILDKTFDSVKYEYILVHNPLTPNPSCRLFISQT